MTVVDDRSNAGEASGKAAGYRGQPQFGENRNEGVRYEIFSGDKFLSVRVSETPSLNFQSAWMFDRGIRELFSGSDPLERVGKAHLNLRSKNLEIEAADECGLITLRTMDGSDLKVEFKSPITSSWSWNISSGDTGIHQPFLDVLITLDGRTFKGYGYCKRYWYVKDIEYWNWRFILGLINRKDGPAMVWAAEANFALEKYDYFKLARPDGSITTGEPVDSHHREMQAFGSLNGTPCEARLKELARFERVMRSPSMDTKIRQKVCELTFVEGHETFTGYALQEVGTGTAR